MKKKNVLTWAMALTTAVALVACGGGVPAPTPESYETVTIKKENITVPMKFSAKLKGETDVTITPQVSGQLMKICVTEGDLVKKGQVLFIIDQRDAQLELQSAQANLQAAIAQENSARIEYESNKNLYEKQIVSKYTFETAENSYNQAKASVAQYRAQVNRAKVNLGYCTITAPVAGSIGEIPVRTGDQVSPSIYLTTVSGNANMDAEFSLPERILSMMLSEGFNTDPSYLAKMSPEIGFIMKNGTEYDQKGKITRATGVVNASTGTISLKATFPNPKGQLYSGMQGNIVIPLKEKAVMVIPQEAVVKLQDKQQVYKVQPDSTVTSVEVTTQDIYDGEHYIALTGLNVGDRIVTVGANNLHEGQKVLFPAAPAKSEK
jgi:membrane fusion protein (multidrug efflux system)